MRRLYDEVVVRGTDYRPDNCQRFFDYIKTYPHAKITAACYNLPAGGDEYAQAVYLYTKRSTGFFKSEKREYHVGYLPRLMAYALGDQGSKLRRGEHIELKLVDFEYDPDGEYAYTFIVDVYAF